MKKINYNYGQLVLSQERDLDKIEEDYYLAINNKDWPYADALSIELVYINTLKHYLYFWEELGLKPYGPASQGKSPPGLDEIVELAQERNLKLEVSANAFAGSKNPLLESSKVVIHNLEELAVLAEFMECLVEARPDIPPTVETITLMAQKNSAEFHCPLLNRLIRMACDLRFRLTLSLTA